MAKTTKSSTNQHYVPQLLLRGFAKSKRRQLYVFDKQTGKVFRSSVRNLACERGFYDLDDGGDPERLDRLLQRLEEKTAPIIASVRAHRVIHQLKPAERQWFAAFIAVQNLRTRQQQEVFDDLNRKLAGALREMGADPSKVGGFREMTKEETRQAMIQDIPRLAFDLLPHFLSKAWILLSAATGTHFWIGDHPVVLANTLNPDDGIQGTLGLAVQGIEIYLPLSGELTLGCLCPSIPAMFAAARVLPIPSEISTHRAEEFLAAFTGRTTLQLDSENVKYHNSLQVIYAERFIFSERNDFDMAREMLASHPDLKTGRRLEMANWPKRPNMQTE